MEIVATQNFIRHARPLAKKYRSFNQDYQALLKAIEENPKIGVDLSSGLRKVRMPIAAKGKGKSGGARVITFHLLEVNGAIYLIDIYDKSEADSADVAVLREIVKELGLDSTEDKEDA